MSYLYITEHGAKISIREGRLICENSEGQIKEIPIELLDGIVVIGNSTINAANIKELLYRGIAVNYISNIGRFYGRLEPIYNTNVKRLKTQLRITEDNEFCSEFASRVLKAKVSNQIIILKRYNRNRNNQQVKEYITKIKILQKKMNGHDGINSIMGYEGIAGRYYFEALSLMIRDEYKFNGRSRNPPLDPFNAILSFGYSMLFSEIYSKLMIRGLNPYIGIIHKDKLNHAALVSDLMEEWRPVIVDSLVLNMLDNFLIKPDEFEKNYETGGIILGKNTIKKFIFKFKEKIGTKISYIEGLDGESAFENAMFYQISSFIKAIENNDVSYYNPIILR